MLRLLSLLHLKLSLAFLVFLISLDLTLCPCLSGTQVYLLSGAGVRC